MEARKTKELLVFVSLWEVLLLQLWLHGQLERISLFQASVWTMRLSYSRTTSYIHLLCVGWYTRMCTWCLMTWNWRAIKNLWRRREHSQIVAWRRLGCGITLNGESVHWIRPKNRGYWSFFKFEIEQVYPQEMMKNEKSCTSFG